MNSKKRSEEIHAIKRCEQRFGIKLSSKELKDIAKSVGKNGHKFVKRLSLRLSAWETTIQDKKIMFVYDNKRKMIVTFMPPDYKLHKQV